MKMRYLVLVALAVLSCASFADTQKSDMGGYYSTQHPKPGTLAAKSLMVPPTDITIINASSEVIYTVVPNSPIHDTNYPEQNDHIRNDSYYGNTQIVFVDQYNREFFNGSVCRQAVVAVYGQNGNYRVRVDSEYCR